MSQTDVVKFRVTLEDFKIIQFQKTTTHFGILEKRKRILRKYSPIFMVKLRSIFKRNWIPQVNFLL